MFRLPREGWFWLLAVVVLFSAGWIKGINLILLLAHLMLSLLALNWVLALRQLRGLSARRQAPTFLHAGEEAHWEVIVDNSRTSPNYGVVITDDGSDHRQQWFASRLAARADTRLYGRAVFPNRGTYKLDPLHAECLHPFGLAGRRAVIGPGTEWIVLPRLGKLNGARFRRWLATAAQGDGRIHRLARPSMIRQDDLHGLRPFRPGDSPRWIHWRTSARRNQKMVREFEETAGQNLLIIFDPWSTYTGPPGGDPEFENALSLAASICSEWCAQRQDQLVLAIAGQNPVVLAGYTCRGTLVQMLRALAVVDGLSAVRAQAVVQALANRSLSDAPVLVIGVRQHSPFSAALASAWHRPVLTLNVPGARDFYDPPNVPARPEQVPATLRSV